MAQISFDVAKQIEESRPQGFSQGQFQYFQLKNDQDEALVRFIYENTSDFEIFTVHEVEIASNNGTRRRKVSCLRNPQDSIDTCPFCAAGIPSKNSFFIKMIQYVANAQGQIEAIPVIWERSLSYATKLKGLIDEYGPLCDSVFKIKRYGVAGSRDTTYEIFYGNPKMYPEEVYVKDFSGFNDVKILGGIVQDRNYEDMQAYVTTGAFPSRQAASTTPQYTPQTPVSNVAQMPTYEPAVSSVPTMPDTQNMQFVPNTTSIPQTPQRQMPPSVPMTNSNPVGAPPQRTTRYY